MAVTRVPNNKVYRFVMAVAGRNDDVERLTAGLRRLVVLPPA